MHGGEHHEPVPEPDVSLSWTGCERQIRYPVQLSPGDKVWCNKEHVVTITQPMEIATEEELKVYICDCLPEVFNPA